MDTGNPFRPRQLSKQEIEYYCHKGKFGRLRPFMKKIYDTWGRIWGKFSYEDQLNIACKCEPPVFFLNNGIMIPHAYGITLSIDEIGCDVCIGQNVMIGTNAKNIGLGESTLNHKPRVGNLIRIYPNAIVSGEISIGDCVIIAAGAIATKHVPGKSVVYGNNQLKPLEEHHVNYLRHVLYHCQNEYVKIPGLMYKDEKMYINTDYLRKRELLLGKIRDKDFSRLLKELF